MDQNSNYVNPPVSNLSNALRNINIQDRNIDITNNDLRQNITAGSNIPEMGHIINNNQFPNSNESLMQQGIISPRATNGINQSSDNTDSTRLRNFFQNQPMSGFTLFSHRSAPNGFKVAIVLSELNLSYNTFFLDFNAGEHRSPEFISITPNARVPALIDHSLDNLSIWESGAILLHLVNKYYKETGEAKLWSDNLSEQAQINAWLFFQTTGHAPMIGQALHFRYFHSEKLPSALERYTEEVRRVYAVIEMALAEKREGLVIELDRENAASYSAGTTPLSQSKFFDYPIWLVCDRITIADLSFVAWNNVVDRIGINIKLEFPEVYKWTKHMMRRPAVIKALRYE